MIFEVIIFLRESLPVITSYISGQL